MRPDSPVARAHAAVAEVLRPGDLAVDATAGNGHDTRFLAERVGPEGRVHALDVQEAAVAATRQRLTGAGLAERVHLHHCGHEHLAEAVPPAHHGRVRVVMFNLGYLPAGDKARITRTETTLAGLRAAADLLAPGGRLTVVAYPGHPGGAEETEAVVQWVADHAGPYLRCRTVDPPTPSGTGPRLLVLDRTPAAV